MYLTTAYSLRLINKCLVSCVPFSGSCSREIHNPLASQVTQLLAALNCSEVKNDLLNGPIVKLSGCLCASGRKEKTALVLYTHKEVFS